MDKIAVVIVHYNTPDETRECLESLAGITPNQNYQVKIFVVDNGSKDVFVLPAKKYKNVEIIRSNTNLGFSGGNNLGFKIAKEQFNPDYFLAINSDTFVEPHFLDHLWTTLKDDNEIGLVSPKIYFAPGNEFHAQSYKKSELGKVIWFVGGIIDWQNLQTFHLGIDEVDRGQFEDITDMDFISGCCFLVRREVLATTGVFDDRYFLYYEDADLSMRIKSAGYKLAICPKSIIWHINGGSGGGGGSNLQVFYQTRNRLLFFFTYGGFRIKITALRLMFKLLFKGSKIERRAAFKFLCRQFGKELVI
ncbi:MAG: glycosyltransferase family 2 protein [Pseudomonadales bacterium]|jgi:GT2 family glycosyltransferase|nr:glycosyltransferase family 2 protein [Pseudomonadales bacterium]